MNVLYETAMATPTQKVRIIKYINQFGSISPIQAFADLGITKLSTRIGELERENGYTFIREKSKGKNRYGETCYYTVYKLKGGGMNGDQESI